LGWKTAVHACTADEQQVLLAAVTGRLAACYDYSDAKYNTHLGVLRPLQAPNWPLHLPISSDSYYDSMVKGFCMLRALLKVAEAEFKRLEVKLDSVRSTRDQKHIKGITLA
jgi:hypothetical protein